MSGHRKKQPVEPVARRSAAAPRAAALSPPAHAPPAVAAPGGSRWWSLALVAGTLIAYLPALWAGYIWDDDDYLTENRLVQAADGLPRLWELRRDAAGALRPNTPQYYPLVFSTFWLEHRLWGLHPAGYHVVNVLLHAGSALVLWRICTRLRIPAAGLIAAVFALHPIHVESVAWVTERKNVLSGLFFFLALLAFLNFADGRGWRWYAATLGLFTAALLSKTVTAMLAPLLVILLWYQRRLDRRRRLATVPLFLLGAAFGLLTAYLEKHHVRAQGVDFELSALARAAILAPSAYLHYARTVLWPHPLIFFYPRWEIDPRAATQYVPLAVLCGGVVVAALGRRRWGRGPLALLAASGVLLFPALGFVDVYPFRFSYVADHFAYLGSLGFIVLAVLALRRCVAAVVPATARHTVTRAGGGALLVTLAALTFQQSRTYEHAITLWETTLARNPRAWGALLNLAQEYERVQRFADAEEMYRRAQAYPLVAPLATARRTALRLRAGDTSGALAPLESYVAEARAALAAGTGPPEAHPAGPGGSGATWFATAERQVRAGQLDQALRSLDWAVQREPANREYRLLRAQVQARLGQLDAAIAGFRALAEEPGGDPRAALGLLAALTNARRYVEAAAVGRRAAAAWPGDPAILQRAAWLLATAPDDGVRDGALALRLAQALTLAGETPEALDTLAAAQAETGDLAAAIATCERALRLTEARGGSDGLDGLGARLAAYRNGRAWRLAPPAASTAP